MTDAVKIMNPRWIKQLDAAPPIYAGTISVPHGGEYGSKRFTRQMLDGTLRIEIHPWGISYPDFPLRTSDVFKRDGAWYMMKHSRNKGVNYGN